MVPQPLYVAVLDEDLLTRIIPSTDHGHQMTAYFLSGHTHRDGSSWRIWVSARIQESRG